jgi:hypothetical protein
LRGLELEQQERARQLAIELLREGGGMRIERGRSTVAFRLADAPEPGVLKRAEDRNQPKQRSRDHEHRHPEWSPHGSESSMRPAPHRLR